MVALTEGLAIDLAPTHPQIRCHVIMPCLVRTGLALTSGSIKRTLRSGGDLATERRVDVGGMPTDGMMDPELAMTPCVSRAPPSPLPHSSALARSAPAPRLKTPWFGRSVCVRCTNASAGTTTRARCGTASLRENSVSSQYQTHCRRCSHHCSWAPVVVTAAGAVAVVVAVAGCADGPAGVARRPAAVAIAVGVFQRPHPRTDARAPPCRPRLRLLVPDTPTPHPV